jgi:hypothetical protein
MSLLGKRWISKRKATVDGCRPNKPDVLLESPKFWTQSVHIAGGLSTGDSQAVMIVPLDCEPVWASIALGNSGTTGSTTVVLGWKTAGGTDPTGGDLSIAAGDAFAYDTCDIFDTNWNKIAMTAEDTTYDSHILHVNIDAVTTTPSADLTVTVGFITR